MNTIQVDPWPDTDGNIVPEGRHAMQQPPWPDARHVKSVRDVLAGLPPLVPAAEVSRFGELLRLVAEGRMHIIQAGDCAEDPADCRPADVRQKIAMVEALADVLAMTTRTPVLRVGRIAGQFAKPRSRSTEIFDGVELPVYRGHMVNDPTPTIEARRADPSRMLDAYAASRAVHETLRHHRENFAGGHRDTHRLWTSHEAILLDYEVPLRRCAAESQQPYLSSTHWPWIGERTRQVDGAHVHLLSQVANPVASKVGPQMTTSELLELCRLLDPHHIPGRLTLIARMGRQHVDKLGELAEAVETAGHPVIWLCDPMHGNTVTFDHGQKTRYLSTMLEEVTEFVAQIRAVGATAGGLHLETTPSPVLECLPDEEHRAPAADAFTSLCDPRLNIGQAVSVVSQWTA